MKKLILLTILISFTYCMGQKKQDSIQKKHRTILKDTLVRPSDAFQVNLGFDDAPVWIWVKFDDVLEINHNRYNTVYGFNFWDEDGFVKKGYYEQDRESFNEPIKDFSDLIINTYPGDKTFQLVSKANDTILLFNVLEIKEYRRKFKEREFQRIPTVKFNQNNEKVSGEDIEINTKFIEDNVVLVTTIDSDGIKREKYKSNCSLKNSVVFSYFDRTSNRVYLLENNCYLEKIE